MHRIASIVAMALIAFGATLPPPTASADLQERCFPETGYCIREPILDYWERNGGLAVFGYPISDLHDEVVEGSWYGPVQWFERDRLEFHGPDGVLAGRLGAKLLHLRGENWIFGQRPRETPPSCQLFTETGYNVCEPFLSYWRNNGGLERFGYPITQPRTETIGDWTGTVQYFERRRMEHHPELAGTPYEVLLGLLSHDVRSYEAIYSCPERLPGILTIAYSRISFRNMLGCPTTRLDAAPMARQRFVNGEMIWVDLGARGKRIYVIISDADHDPSFYYRVFADTWSEGQPVSGGWTPPGPGLYEPVRGFGKVWRENPDVREAIGWAWETEQTDHGTVQLFESGVLMYMDLKGWVYGFGPDQTHIASTPPTF